MKPVRALALVAAGVALTACATVDTVTRSTPYESIPGDSVPVNYDFSSVENPDAVTVASAAAEVSPSDAKLDIAPGKSPVHVNKIFVQVPRSLTVSEANRYYPGGDIVWREDPIGDRHAQVQRIFEDALKAGVKPLDGPVKVDLAIEVVRFHALTEKARYTIGGTHAITFNLAILNPESGELIVPARQVRADLDAFGGQQALRAEADGLTQKVRISNHLAEVVRQELSNSDGYTNANLGFFQLVNLL